MHEEYVRLDFEESYCNPYDLSNVRPLLTEVERKERRLNLRFNQYSIIVEKPLQHLLSFDKRLEIIVCQMTRYRAEMFGDYHSRITYLGHNAEDSIHIAITGNSLGWLSYSSKRNKLFLYNNEEQEFNIDEYFEQWYSPTQYEKDYFKMITDIEIPWSEKEPFILYDREYISNI